MAIEDIPKKRRGLGERLEDIISRQTEGEYDTYGETLFGGRGTATEEEVAEALKNVSTEKPTPLPPPEYVLSYQNWVNQSTKGKKSVRPDLYESNYGSGSKQSTRVFGMQWIPTFISGELVIGDMVVAFARAPLSGGKFYVYEDISSFLWSQYRDAEDVSLGRFVGSLGNYHILTDGDESKYKKLHKNTKGGLPWDDWIFDAAGFYLSGRYPNSTELGEVAKKYSSSGATKRAKEMSKAGRKERKATGERLPSRRGKTRFRQAGEEYGDNEG